MNAFHQYDAIIRGTGAGLGIDHAATVISSTEASTKKPLWRPASNDSRATFVSSGVTGKSMIVRDPDGHAIQIPE